MSVSATTIRFSGFCGRGQRALACGQRDAGGCAARERRLHVARDARGDRVALARRLEAVEQRGGIEQHREALASESARR